MNAITIELPWPAAALSPNARGHWSKKAKAAKDYRMLAGVLAVRETIVVGHKRGRKWKRASLAFTFVATDNQRRDVDNLMASMKSAIDGIVDARILADDNNLKISGEIVKGEKRCVVVTITRLEE